MSFNKKKLSCFLFLQLIILIGMFVFNYQNVGADDTNRQMPVGMTADQLRGVNGNPGVLVVPSFSYPQVKKNSSGQYEVETTTQDVSGLTQIIEKKFTNGAILTNNGFVNSTDSNYLTGLINLNGLNKFYGYTWSNDANRFDINKSQTLSMWINDATPNTKGGLAFVLQNDPRGVNAVSTHNVSVKGLVGGTKMRDILSPYETLGVWAPDTNSTAHPAGGIANSWAIELDTDANNDSGTLDNSFDEGLTAGKMHMATNYPGLETSYQPLANGAYKLIHVDPSYHVFGGEGSGYYWHHFSVTYNPTGDGKTANITYKFNDKNMDGTPNENKGTETLTNPIPYEKTVSVDLSAFDLKGSNKLRWGLVSASNLNDLEGRFAVTMEHVSTLVNASTDSQIIDNTQNDKVLDSTDKYVNAGDNLTLKYNLHYDSGQTSLTKVNSVIDIPSDINITSGKITYKNGNSELISSSDILNGEYNHQLSYNLDSNNNEASIELYGTANDVSSDASVAPAHAVFRGDEYVGDLMTQDFIIKAKDNRTLNLDSSTSNDLTISSSDTASINGSLSYNDNSDFDNFGVEVHADIDGKEQTPEQFQTSSDKNKINFTESLSGLSPTEAGKPHIVTIYGVDSYGHISNKKVVNINVSDKYAKLTTNKNYSFGAINSGYNGIVHRTGNWIVGVDVSDSRWRLTASATPLRSEDGSPFNGEVIYRDGNNTQSMQNGDVNLGESTTPVTQNINVASWQKDDGVLLNSTSVTGKGTYSGVITWTLVDSFE